MPEKEPGLPPMNIVVASDHGQMSHAASEWIFEELTGDESPEQVILVATGNTPMQCYANFDREVRDLDIETSALTLVQLDEYAGIPPDDPRTLYGWMDRTLLKPLNIADSQIIRFDIANNDPAEVIARYDAQIREAGGIDIAILGLGPNGHLGFNEPPSEASSPTRLIDLSPESLISNAPYFPEGTEVPAQAYTCGMNTILAARNILVLVSGKHKAGILRQTLLGDITPQVPASLLRLVSEKVWLFADEAAWSEME